MKKGKGCSGWASIGLFNGLKGTAVRVEKGLRERRVVRGCSGWASIGLLGLRMVSRIGLLGFQGKGCSGWASIGLLGLIMVSRIGLLGLRRERAVSGKEAVSGWARVRAVRVGLRSRERVCSGWASIGLLGLRMSQGWDY